MSNVSNRHNVLPFQAGKSVSLSGQRLAKIGYKNTEKQKAKFSSVCVSVPFIDGEQITESIAQLVPYVRNYLESVQDSVIRSLYESSEGNLSSVSDEEISVQACIAYLEAESSGNRLKKEYIESWFDTEISDNLSVVVAEKLNLTDIECEQVAKHVKVYKELLASLAGGKTFLQATQIKGCRTAIALANSEDEIAKKLISRLDVMEKKEKIEDLLEL